MNIFKIMKNANFLACYAVIGLMFLSSSIALALPTDGLIFHLKADAGVTVDSNNRVISWEDQVKGVLAVPKNQDGSVVEDQMPVLAYQATEEFTGSFIDFDGIDDFLMLWLDPENPTSDGDPIPIDGQAELTFFIVYANIDSTIDTGRPFGNSNTNGHFYAYWSGGGDRFAYNTKRGDVSKGITTVDMPYSTQIDGAISGLRSIPGKLDIWGNCNGFNDYRSVTTTGLDPLTTPRPKGIGCIFPKSLFYPGGIAEIIIYNRAISEGERNWVGYELSQKYGITTSYTEPSFYTLTINDNLGAGLTTPSAGIHQYLAGTTIYLNAENLYADCPNVYEFSNWTGDANDLSSPQTIVTMDGNKSVTANYTLSSTVCSAITIETSPTGITSVEPAEGNHYYLPGDVINLSASRYVGCPDVYEFSTWSANVDDPASAATTYTVAGDDTITVTFLDARVCGDECHPLSDYDTNDDCIVDIIDLSSLASTWLTCTDPSCD